MNASIEKIPASGKIRASTGVPGLDDVLNGGLPTHHIYLIEGSPGAGKTTLGVQFLREGVARGEKTLYLALSETKSEIDAIAESHGWSLQGIDIFEVVNVNGLSAELEQSILHPSEVELGETTRSIMARIDKLKPARVVFDSLSEMRLLAQEPLRYRREILALKHFFANRKCTVLLLDDRTAEIGDLQLHSIAHGVISLEALSSVYGPERRHLRIVKMRGVKYRGGDHDFLLDTGGIRVFPRLVAAEHDVEFKPISVSTGNAAFNAILGGGLAKGNNTLLSGPAGIGKTTTAMACVLAALKRGERAVYYLFDEGKATLIVRAKALGMDIESYLESGQLLLFTLDPAEVSPGQFAQMARHAVESGVHCIVIDSLNAYLHSMPGSKYLVLQMHELLSYFNRCGIVTILILSTHGVAGTATDVDLSYLSDTIVLFRFFEARGSLLKAISVLKSRTSDHELTIREFRLVGGVGIQIGQAMTDFEGVLLGAPAYRGKSALLSEGSPVNRA